LPPGFSMTPDSPPAVLVVAGVQNPPAADYSQFDWTVAAQNAHGDTIYNPGFARNDLTIHSDDPYQPNCGLTPGRNRAQVSATDGVELTATVRDRFGNPVDGLKTVIEVTQGSASPVNPPDDIQKTGQDGTVSEQFADTL